MADIAKQVYTSRLSRWQTRILILKPGELNSDLVADLVVVDLILGEGVAIHETQELITYTALSYAWGKPVFDQRISVNGHRYPITEHLYLALQRVRHPSENWYGWIDALCINQSDSNEHSAQVANMMAIFWKGSQVRVWLGDCEKSGQGSMGRSEMLAMDYLHNCDPFFPSWAPHWNHEQPVHDLICAPQTFNLIKGLTSVREKPWQTRVWIRQEVWAAQAVQVQLGDRIIT